MQIHEYKFNINDSASKTLMEVRDGLVRMRESTKQPLLLEWQLRLYDFILTEPDTDAKAQAYFDSKGRVTPLPFDRAANRAGLIRAAEAVGFPEKIPPVGK
jgi:hypothetical protein